MGLPIFIAGIPFMLRVWNSIRQIRGLEL